MALCYMTPTDIQVKEEGKDVIKKGTIIATMPEMMRTIRKELSIESK
ncbi:hypothetical protein CCACVL1_10421 [Corchorus capsularis]|uniref:Uncharacterized protein n=1 Tax=Corchorus capsularis TaxID=210143 RepID=A0A1R3IR79_COCAP|nr:hypothetical protein CCACVL1_10421 [Corchorus capsularis]